MLSTTYHDSDERVLEFLVCHLGIDVNARQPTSISRMGVVPANRVLNPADLAVDQIHSIM